jgi:4-phosphopantoate--beta-alanine ligase
MREGRVEIPLDHPRFASLKEREALIGGLEEGITVPAGLIAQGRGEAFDYLLGEETIPPAKKAIRAAAALLLLAERPVLSVNGNTAALSPEGLVDLSRVLEAPLEVNLFYRSEERVKRIRRLLLQKGAKTVYPDGLCRLVEIHGLSSERRWVAEEGIHSGDVILVSLEDGDRTEALLRMGKRVVAIDLNPLSRTARKATIPIVDNFLRALPLLTEEVMALRGEGRGAWGREVEGYDRDRNLEEVLAYLCRRLQELKPE